MTPIRQIRAHFDADTITVYQAYSAHIATAAVNEQKLNASSEFSLHRMTWIKPSWAWMLYRAGYSYKDARQTHILALKMTHRAFKDLLRRAVLAGGPGAEDLQVAEAIKETSGRSVASHDTQSGEGGKLPGVRVQWDPERSVRLEKLAHRSIQIGIPGALVPEWVRGIVAIEDVTRRARALKSALDGEGEQQLSMEDLIVRGLVPVERVFEVEEELSELLQMTGI